MSVCCVLNGVCRATMTNATSISTSKSGVICNVRYAESVRTSFVSHKEEEEEDEEEEEEEELEEDYDYIMIIIVVGIMIIIN